MEENQKKEWIRILTAELEEMRAMVHKAKLDTNEARASLERQKLETQKYKLKVEELISKSNCDSLRNANEFSLSIADFEGYLKKARIEAAQQTAYLQLPWWKKLFA